MGAIDTQYTFTATDTITSTKMNNIIDQTTITGTAITGTTLDVTTSGQLKVRSQGITSTEMSENSVRTIAITDSNVTTGKIADYGVTTAKIADSNVTPSKLSQPLTLETAKATTSGTTVDFTGIPSWVKRISLVISGFSTNGASIPIVQLGGSSGFSVSGYLSYYGLFRSGAQITGFSSTGFGLSGTSANDIRYLVMTFVKISGSQWVASHSGGLFNGTDAYALSGGGNVTLSGTLDKIRLTTTNGTDVFDGGSVNIVYE